MNDTKVTVSIDAEPLTLELTIIGSGHPSDDQPYDQSVCLEIDEAEALAHKILAQVAKARGYSK